MEVARQTAQGQLLQPGPAQTGHEQQDAENDQSPVHCGCKAVEMIEAKGALVYIGGFVVQLLLCTCLPPPGVSRIVRPHQGQ